MRAPSATIAHGVFVSERVGFRPAGVELRQQRAQDGVGDMSLRRDVPLLNALAVFEAAARTSSFTVAAKELHIAQSAVSRHVSKLEQYFGLRLFERERQRLVLTSQGRRLADSVT